MAWEKRNGSDYYYVSSRFGSKVRKLYFGRGPHAELAAGALDAARQQRRQAAAAAKDERVAFEEVERLVADSHAQNGDWIAAELIVRGYHQHRRGPWRKRNAVDALCAGEEGN